MSERHASWLVIYPSGRRWFQSLPAALRYLAHHEPALGPAYLVGLDTVRYP